jgi:hypothetical protein
MKPARFCTAYRMCQVISMAFCNLAAQRKLEVLEAAEKFSEKALGNR